MLEITVEQEPGNITLKLEGSLSGAWVSELEDVSGGEHCLMEPGAPSA